MQVELIEIYANIDGEHKLRSIGINPETVAFSREEVEKSKMLQEGKGKFPSELNPSVKFTKLYLSRGGNNTSEITVVGDRASIDAKLNGSKSKKLLNG